jgi:tRNA(Arg) A34 adenosine deaminase TadA
MIRGIILLTLSVFLICLTVPPASVANEALPSGEETVTATDHEPFVRQAFDLAIRAGKKGNHPFGAVLVHHGKVILTAENTVNTDKNFTHHAETNLLAKARRELSREVLRQSTMYTSAQPCMFCCSAMWYSGVKGVVYGVSSKAISRLTNFEEKSIPCNKLYEYTGSTFEWIGPVLEEEGLQAFCYWPEDSFRPSLIERLETPYGIGKPCDKVMERQQKDIVQPDVGANRP